jgi:hypothetical protein
VVLLAVWPLLLLLLLLRCCCCVVHDALGYLSG